MYVELKDVNKYYGAYHATREVSLGIKKGHTVALLGPSGSGKTTILRMIAGLERADSGEIWINGRQVNDVAPADRQIGFVFQNYALFRHMTIEDNIAFGMRVQKKSRKDIAIRVAELLELIGLSHLAKRYPNQLSGGQKQRVAFARALATNPAVLLLDEPFAALDVKVKEELRRRLKAMIQQVGITTIFVTHDQEEAVELADDIIVTNEGQVEQIGTPIEIYQHPNTPFVAKFMGKSTIIDRYEQLAGFSGESGGTEAVIRPEFVKILKKSKLDSYPEGAEEGMVESIVFRGTRLLVTVIVRGMRLEAYYSMDAGPIELGELVHVFIARMYVVDGKQTYMRENSVLAPEDMYYI